MQNPLGPYGNLVASILAVLIVGAWLAAELHLLGLVIAPGSSLPQIATVTIGVVFGTQVVQNGTQTKAVAALQKAEAALARLDAIKAPSAVDAAAIAAPSTPRPGGA